MEITCTEKELFVFNKIAHAAQEMQLPCYIVGGFVRDKLLSRKTKDADIVCVGDGIQLAHEVAMRFKPVPKVAYFKTFGTAQLKTDDLEIEFVGARKESYGYHSRNPEVKPGTIEDDQLRRDFTINALAISLNKEDFGKLIDPFNGLNDLKNKIIQTPQDATKTFSDDPLRMMRAIRFASQLNFQIAPATFQAIKDNVERIKIISQERITEEINKILLSQKPSIGFDLLYKSGLLHIIFPKMVDLAGAEYIDGQGHKDNFYHTLQVIDNISENTDDLWLRWAALLHDIGKPPTKKFEKGHGWTFHGHEVVGGRMVPKIFNALRLPQNEKLRFVKKMVELHLRPISLTKENITDSAIRRLLFDAGEDIDALMILCRADITSKNKLKVKRYLENFDFVEQRLKEVEESDRIRNWQPPITGELIMQIFGLPPGRNVGILKNAIREAILDGVIPNNYDDAYDLLIKKSCGNESATSKPYLLKLLTFEANPLRNKQMAILKFRVYFEEDDSIYRDVAIKHTQSFSDLHGAILKAYEFDSKHQATFYRSNDHWQKGREISLEKYKRSYKVDPLIMSETIIGSEIKDPNQKFVYTYDFLKNWSFLVELINVTKEESSKITYPAVVKKEGIGPSQYGVKGLVGDKLTEVEEKYDLTKGAEGFSVEGNGVVDEDTAAPEDEAENGEEEQA